MKHFILALLVIVDKITPAEADIISANVGKNAMPKDWRDVIKTIEESLGRKL